MKKRTRVNHPPPAQLPPGNRPVVAPIYQTVKFEFDGLDQTLEYLEGRRAGYFYTRSSNPTTRQLELTLAELQGRDECLATGSGVAAIANLLIGLTRQGDHVVCFIETYGPTRHLVRRLLGRFGVRHTMLSIEDLEALEQVLEREPTRLVLFESPTNPINKVADIAALTGLAHAHGALAVLDNTFAGLHQHGEYDIDVFVHSLTKYAAGAGDVMGGAVIARTEIMRDLRADFGVLGAVLDPHAAYLIQRGLRTYFVRYEAQSATAQRLAERLEAHEAVERVHYPGLRSHPRHALAREQMRDFGAVVAFDLKGGREAASRFVDALELFALTPSLGSTESLVIAPQMMTAGDLSTEELRRSGITPGTVRLSIGLEDPEDLLDDLTRALGALSG
jgi:cystathionine beta-lyase/cystathionine gamma-synthase